MKKILRVLLDSALTIGILLLIVSYVAGKSEAKAVADYLYVTALAAITLSTIYVLATAVRKQEWMRIWALVYVGSLIAAALWLNDYLGLVFDAGKRIGLGPVETTWFLYGLVALFLFLIMWTPIFLPLTNAERVLRRMIKTYKRKEVLR